MASAEPSRAHTSEPIDVPNTFPLTQAMGQTPAGSTPVEMTTLSRPENVPTEPPEDKPAQESRPIQAKHSTSSTAEPSGIQDHTSQPLSLTTQPTEATSAAAQSQPVDTTPDCPPSSSTDHSPLVRSTTEPAIGPSTDKPSLIQADASSQTLFITLLLTNGARHPYKIDEKYLNKRNVSVEGNNPVLMSIYTLKELIWRDWRDEWEPRPSSPSSIRLIYAGFMPGDNSRLQECRFHLGPTPHVVHMTIKPQDFIDDEEAQKGGGREREAGERSPRCRCCMM